MRQNIDAHIEWLEECIQELDSEIEQLSQSDESITSPDERQQNQSSSRNDFRRNQDHSHLE